VNNVQDWGKAMQHRPLRKLLLLLGWSVMVGCASAPALTDMTPAPPMAVAAPTGKTLQVMDVVGGEKAIPLKIENAKFREALVAALKDSGLFQAVLADQEGDYRLTARIISLEVAPGFPTRAVLFVNYKLYDAKSQREIWKENILSQYDAGVQDDFFGVAKAQAGAVKNNLSQLVNRLSAVFQKATRGNGGCQKQRYWQVA
jgi:hypothetical protein